MLVQTVRVFHLVRTIHDECAVGTGPEHICTSHTILSMPEAAHRIYSTAKRYYCAPTLVYQYHINPTYASRLPNIFSDYGYIDILPRNYPGYHLP